MSKKFLPKFVIRKDFLKFRRRKEMGQKPAKNAGQILNCMQGLPSWVILIFDRQRKCALYCREGETHFIKEVSDQRAFLERLIGCCTSNEFLFDVI